MGLLFLILGHQSEANSTSSVLVYSGTPSVLTDVTGLIYVGEVTPPDCDVAIGDDRTRSLYDSYGLDRPKDG